jgi:dipeptidyl aminopeptidase/acylaminoacyl peptidase
MRAVFKPLWCVVIGLCVVAQAHATPPAQEGIHQAAIARALSLMPDELERLVRDERVVPTWRENGEQFWFITNRAQGVEYLRVDPESKTVRPLLDRGKLETALREVVGSEARALPEKLDGFSYDFDKNEITFDYAGRRWGYSPRTDHLAPIEKAEPGHSPDRHWQVLVRDYNLFLANKSNGQVRQLTTDGTSAHPYARPVVSLKEMEAQETTVPKLAPDVVWSPDSSRFVTHRMDLDGATRLSAVQSSPPGGGPPRGFDYIYPLTGDEHVPVAHTLVVNAASGAITQVQSPTQDILYSGGPEYQWTRDSAAVLQRIASRGYGSLRLYAIDAATGKSVVLTQDGSSLFVDFYAQRWKYLKGADATAWLADDQGWNQLFLVDRRGKRRQLTTGSWTVADVAGGDESGRHLFVIGRGKERGRDPYLASLYSVDTQSRRTLSLTPEPLDHEVYVSPDGRVFVDNQSLVNRPTTTVLRSTRDGSVLMKLQSADIGELTKRRLNLPEPFTATAADGKTPLYGVLYKPSTFDPHKRYPVVEYIYTGPHAITVPKSFTAGLDVDAAYAVAELGYIVVVVDGRGTSGRGRAFLDPAYRNLHAVGLDDHIAAIRALAAQRPYMNVTAVGVYGYSAGGYDVVRAMTERPDFYKVGIAASGNQDNRLDKAVWNEQWMGFPLGPQYDANSNITWANKLQGKLFLAYGELDENVPTAATLRLVDALIKADKPFELLVVPNANHFLASVPYFNQRRFEFLLRNLPPPR